MLTMPVMLGSEWCHNLSHAAAAKLVGKPVDAIRVMFGMPLLVYHDINDENVTPRQHIIRGLGGPVFNLLALCIAALLKPFTKPKSAARDVVNMAFGTNLFLLTVGLLPIPGIDGGAVLKWALVEGGRDIQKADQTVSTVNGVLSTGLAAGAVLAFKKRRRLLGGLLGTLTGISLAVALGLLKEQK
jgi:Zn-dependent protease